MRKTGPVMDYANDSRNPLAVAGRLATAILAVLFYALAVIAIVGTLIGFVQAVTGDISWRTDGIWAVSAVGLAALSWIVAALGRIGLDDEPIGGVRTAAFELARLVYRELR